MKMVISLLLMCFSLHGADITSQWFSNGQFIHESESQKMTNGFGGKLDFTTDGDFLNNWQKHWSSVSTTKRNDGVYVVLFIASNSAIQEDFVYDVSIKKPDGSICASFTNLVASKHPYLLGTGPHNEPPRLKLSPRFTILQIEPQDPVGTYTVEAVLRDNLRKIKLKLKKELAVEK